MVVLIASNTPNERIRHNIITLSKGTRIQITVDTSEPGFETP